MLARLLAPVLALAAPLGHGQGGLFGPVVTHVRAGDTAPAIPQLDVLGRPAAAETAQPQLTGQHTYLAFFPNTTANQGPAEHWNKVADQFAGKPIQLVWITAEDPAKVRSWLQQHPIHGWVLSDPAGRVGQSFGLTIPNSVLIGPDLRILGFDPSVLPSATMLQAALSGRTTTDPPTRDTMRSFMASGKVLLWTQPRSWPNPNDHRPNLPPSNTVHITASEGDERGNFSTDDYLVLKGYTLLAAIKYLYGVNAPRILLPASTNNGAAYDIAILLPSREGHDAIRARVRQALEQKFQIMAVREPRTMPVYVLTNDPGRTPPPAPSTSGPVGAWSGGVTLLRPAKPDQTKDIERPATLQQVAGINLEGTPDQLCDMLESSLDRPVINETTLEGSFRFDGGDPTAAMRESANFWRDYESKIGLRLTPQTRSVEVLHFIPR